MFKLLKYSKRNTDLGTGVTVLIFLVVHHQFVFLHLLIFTISLSYVLRFIYGLVGTHWAANEKIILGLQFIFGELRIL